MGAETKILVRVLKAYEDTVEVFAVTLAEAEKEAKAMEGVVAVLGCGYAEREEYGKKKLVQCTEWCRACVHWPPCSHSMPHERNAECNIICSMRDRITKCEEVETP